MNFSWKDLLAALIEGRNARSVCQHLVDAVAADFPGYHVLLTPSGRGGLFWLLQAMNRRKVLIPAYTCSAVTEATVLAGCQPVHIRMVEDSLEMDLDDLKRHADPDSVIIVTHLFGIPSRIAPIVDLARSTGSLVIEDVAAGLGGKLAGKPLGTFSDAAVFSFDPTKTLHVPCKAGFILVKEDALAAQIRRRWQPTSVWLGGLQGVRAFLAAMAYLVLQWPVAYRLFYWLNFERHGRYTLEDARMEKQPGRFYTKAITGWQAALALRQWNRRHQIYAARQQMFRAYHRRLQEMNDIKWKLPPTDFAEAVCAKFCLRILGDKMRFYRKCASRGVDMAFSFTHITASKDHHEAHLLAAQMLNLPFYPKLPEQDLERVAETCLQAVRETT